MIEDLQNEISELKKRTKMYEEILDKILQGIYVVDTDSRIVWFNRILQRLDGINREDVIGKEDAAVWGRTAIFFRGKGFSAPGFARI